MTEEGVIIEIRPGPGGQEAKIWQRDLLRMYARFAERHSWRWQELGDGVLKIIGPDAYSLLRHEAGVHRVQRIPVTEKRGRIHTSTASVAVLPLVSSTTVILRPDDMEVEFFRAGGHGGQNVNKVSTAVRIRHKPTGLVVVSQSQRYQEQNRRIAEDLLRSKLWQREQEKKEHLLNEQRRAAVGSGERAEKIRTYNFPQNRVKDHRINKTWHNLKEILDGRLDEILLAFKAKK